MTKLIIFAGVMVAVVGFSQTFSGQGSKPSKTVASQEAVPSNPMAGRIVFEEKRCIECHAIDGFGGNVGPDLGRDKYFGSFYDLASRLWNHAPEMTVQTGFREKEWPTLSSEELDQLISYLFYLRYLGEPGSVSQGKKLIRSKKCLSCHQIGDEGAAGGISLDGLRELTSPIYIAQVIWNHGPEMQEKMIALGIDRPTFGERDITDISAYLRAFSRGTSTKRQYMSPGNPKSGAALFQEKGCTNCHATQPGQASAGTWLGDMDLHQSVTNIAGAMWNHGNLMWESMKEKEVKWPTFEGSEMADIIAYLYFFDYQSHPLGDTKEGMRVFQTKACATCHGPRQEYAFGHTIFLATPTDLVRTMWNHVPYMRELVVTKNIEWPKLTEEDLRNLYAYLLHWSPGQ